MSKKDRVTVALSLWRFTVEQLDELVVICGTTREQLVESLVHQQYAARHRELSQSCPWNITEAAIRAVCTELRRLRRPYDRDAALEVITAAAIDARNAEREGRRSPTPQDNGALRYRGPSPLRLNLFVRDSSIVQVSAFNRRPIKG